MNAYSLGLRLKVLDAPDRGIPQEGDREDLRCLDAHPSPGRTPSSCTTSEERGTLWRQLEENADATLERHCELWDLSSL